MELLNKVYEAVDKRQGDDIVVLDFRNQSPFLDYFIVCSARNARLAASIVDEVEELAQMEGIDIISKDTSKDSGWNLIDIGSIVVHIFVGENREKYDLEGLWKDLMIEL